jgi:hypothetical protein
MTFDGFNFTVKKQQDDFTPAEKPKHSMIDASLEELVFEQRKKRSGSRAKSEEALGNGEVDQSEKHERKRQQTINLRLSRNMLQQICDSLNIDIRGYYVSLEAVLRPQK